MSYTYKETRTDMPVYDEGTRTREDNDIIFVTTQSDKVKADIGENKPCGEPYNDYVDNYFNVPINASVPIKKCKLQPLNSFNFKEGDCDTYLPEHKFTVKTDITDSAHSVFKEQANISHKKEANPIFNIDNLNVVEHPNHYGAGNGGLQCIEAMLQTFGKNATMDFCKLNAFKYIWRSDHKDKEVQDMEKAKRYLEYWHVLAKLSGNSDDGSFHAYLND